MLRSRFAYLLFLIVFSALKSSAQHAVRPDPATCQDNAEATQAELDDCAAAKAKAAEADRRKVVADLMKLRKSDAKFLAALRAEEQQWVRYRDAFLRAVYPYKDNSLSHYGSMFPMEYDLVVESMTRNHIKDLQGMREPDL